MSKEFLKKILVPVDGSASSLMAEETTAIIAKKTKATVTVFTVRQEFELGYRLPSKLEDEIIGNLEQRAEKILFEARALFKEENVTIETKISRSRDPASKILELSKDYDLIVMGAQGENEKDPYALGSVTKKVMRHIVCPTLIAKRVSALSNLLVCVDGSDHSIKALNYAVELAQRMDSKVTLLNVQDRRIYDFSPKDAEKLGEQILSRARNAVRKTRREVDKKLEFGVPSDKIVEVAEEGEHDLIVLGSRGLGTVKKFLLGSISDDVSHKSKTSVLIVPAKT